MGGESLTRGVLLFFLYVKGMSLTRSLFCCTFSTKLWNFYGVFGGDFLQKAQNMEFVIMESSANKVLKTTLKNIFSML